jgi:hypothetical protein
VRTLRPGDLPGDQQVVLRATLGDITSTVLDIVDAALQSARTYVLEREGVRLLLFGVSVFAVRDDEVLPVLSRFAMAPGFVRVVVGTLRDAGFEVLPTGTNPEHFDIQLVRGRGESDFDVGETVDLVTAAAEQLMAIAGPIEPNPAYADAEEEL